MNVLTNQGLEQFAKRIDAKIQNIKFNSILASPFLPDYKNMENQSIIVENGDSWTSSRYGFIYVETGVNSIDSGWLELNIWINENRISWNLFNSTLNTEHLIRGSELLSLSKDDIIRVKVNFDENRIDSESFYVTAHFIPPKSVNTLPFILSQHTWEPNVEYEFENGSYGQRYVGTISSGANTHTLILDNSINSDTASFIEFGGWLTDNTGLKMNIGMAWPSWFSLLALNTSGLVVISLVGARVNAPYDIWVKYVKN